MKTDGHKPDGASPTLWLLSSQLVNSWSISGILLVFTSVVAYQILPNWQINSILQANTERNVIEENTTSWYVPDRRFFLLLSAVILNSIGNMYFDKGTRCAGQHRTDAVYSSNASKLTTRLNEIACGF